MIITKIKRIASTSRFNVYADEKWCGIFLDEILAKYKIATNQEWKESEFRKIKEENDRKVAFDLAVSYMEKYVVSEKGIRDYLKKKLFSGTVIFDVVAKLKDYGFVDDEAFAKNYFETLSASRGKRAIANKLKEKGIANEIIDNLLENVEDEEEIAKATALAEKFVKNRDYSLKTKQKCIAHLIYKGYDYSVAQQATNITFSDKGETNEDWL